MSVTVTLYPPTGIKAQLLSALKDVAATQENLQKFLLGGSEVNLSCSGEFDAKQMFVISFLLYVCRFLDNYKILFPLFI